MIKHQIPIIDHVKASYQRRGKPLSQCSPNNSFKHHNNIKKISREGIDGDSIS